MANLNNSDLILDFGCGAGILKNNLKSKGYNVVGYDLTPEHSDLGDYTTIKPTKIFAMDVFEHMFREDIKETLDNFKKMSDEFNIVVSIPVEGWFYRTLRKMIGKRPIDIGHVTNLKEIMSLMNNNFKFLNGTNLFNMSYIGVWIYKKP